MSIPNLSGLDQQPLEYPSDDMQGLEPLVEVVSHWLDENKELLTEGGITQTELIELIEDVLESIDGWKREVGSYELTKLFGNRNLFPYFGRDLVTNSVAEAIYTQMGYALNHTDIIKVMRYGMLVRDALLSRSEDSES